MKFKVGDKVRLTRETLLRMRHDGLSLMGPSEFVVKKICGDKIFYENVDLLYIRDGCLELVPEEPEFEFGEEIEVWNPLSDRWDKRIFISKIPGKVGCAYACVYKREEDNFKNGKTFEVQLYKYARKLSPQLTRKEIAEKFGVSEDFTLVD